MGNVIIRAERAHKILGVEGRAMNVIGDPEASVVWNQEWVSGWRTYNRDDERLRLRVELRFDDNCHNGHDSFAITATGQRVENGRWREGMAGCCHGEIAEVFPELASLIKWHLTSTDGPMHYVANTIYLASDRDHWGLRKGEARQLKNGRTGVPYWDLVTLNLDGTPVKGKVATSMVASEHAPQTTYQLVWRPHNLIGEGKARELDAARSAAVWPDASDATLLLEADALTALLLARLPTLLAEFRRVMVSVCGFHWAVK